MGLDFRGISYILCIIIKIEVWVMFTECIARIIEAIYRNVYTLIAVLEPLINKKKINRKHVQ